MAEGTTTSAIQVAYETSLLETGADEWWLVAWVYADDHQIYVTDPSNVAEAVRSAQEKLAEVIPDSARRLRSPSASLEAEQVLDAITDQVVSEARLSGWQHHVLGRAEADRTMLIEIESNNDVVFASRSGRSRTSTTRSTQEVTTPLSRSSPRRLSSELGVATSSASTGVGSGSGATKPSSGDPPAVATATSSDAVGRSPDPSSIARCFRNQLLAPSP